MKCCKNFRELGGIKNNEGKKVVMGKIFRSDNFFAMDLADEQEFLMYEIRHIVDFRSDEERKEHPYYVPKDCSYYHKCALQTREGLENFYFPMLIHENSTSDDIYEVSRFVRGGYEVLPFDNMAYKKVFDLMLQENEGIVFHCSSGKDRTGLMAALILKVLDVNEEHIMKDYLESNPHVIAGTSQKAKDYGFSKEASDTFIYCCTVHEELLEKSFEKILEKYKDWNTYFDLEYGLDKKKIEIIKNKYLE